MFSALPPAFQTFENCREILLTPQVHPHRNIDFGMQNIFGFELLHQTVGDEFIVRGGLQVFGDRLERHQEPGKVFVLVKLFNLSERTLLASLLSQLKQSRRIDRALKMQMQLSFRKREYESTWARRFEG